MKYSIVIESDYCNNARSLEGPGCTVYSILGEFKRGRCYYPFKKYHSVQMFSQCMLLSVQEQILLDVKT